MSGALSRNWVTACPIFRVHDLLEAWFQDSAKVIVDFDENILSFASILTVKVNNRVGCGSRTCKVVQYSAFSIGHSHHTQTIFDCVHRLRVGERVVLRKELLQHTRSILRCGILGINPTRGRQNAVRSRVEFIVDSYGSILDDRLVVSGIVPNPRLARLATVVGYQIRRLEMQRFRRRSGVRYPPILFDLRQISSLARERFLQIHK